MRKPNKTLTGLALLASTLYAGCASPEVTPVREPVPKMYEVEVDVKTLISPSEVQRRDLGAGEKNYLIMEQEDRVRFNIKYNSEGQ